MKYRLIYTFALFLTSLCMMAQSLPVLPSDAAVNQGVMPNGMAYYVVANKSAKGMADFALVQRTGRNTAGDSLSYKVVGLAKDALAQLPRLKDGSPQSFLTSHGVNPGQGGFVKVSENATVFLFDNVMLSGSASVLDSTLLVIMDIADRISTTDDEFIRKWYTPSDHAVIIAGDIDAKSVVDKLKYMSMMTPGHEPQVRHGYEWQGCDSMNFVCHADPVRDLATVSARWRMARTPREYMNTVQPAIYEMFVDELGRVVTERIRHILHEKGVPYASVSYDHVDSIESLCDESFTVTVIVRDNDAVQASSVLASVLSSVDSGGVSCGEFFLAKQGYMDELSESERKPLKRNSEYVERCVSAFLHNATLASQKEKLAFHQSRMLEDTAELRLFNSIASAILDDSENLTLEYANGVSCEDSLEVRTAFESAWKDYSEKGNNHVPVYEAVTALPGPSEKLKVSSTVVEPMSKGEIWTFANGFKVIYHRMPSYGNLYYALALNGGYSALSDLQQGEGAFLSDYLRLCRISGVSGRDFWHFLESEGVEMTSKVNISSTVISGHAPDGKAELLLKVLLAVLNQRDHDADEWAYHMKGERLLQESLTGSVQDRLSSIDKVLCPDYAYTSYKDADNVSDDLGIEADAFFSHLSSKTNDGVLVLVGDVDGYLLKKLLMTYAREFRTTDRAFARPKVDYRTVSGWTTYMLEGDVNSVDIVMSVPMPLTIDNRMAATLAAMMLKQSLARATVNTGMYLSMAYSFDVYPQERFSVMISLNEADADGFASDVELQGPVSALEILRDALRDLSHTPVSKTDLASYKALLVDRTKQQLADPRYWVESLVRRYVDGKDFTTGYESKIAAVSEEKVWEILASLNDGAKVEYTIRKK